MFQRLPCELQESILRKARFLEARMRLERWLVTRVPCRVGTYRLWDCYQIYVQLSTIKMLCIEHYSSRYSTCSTSMRERPDTIIVDVIDYSALNVHLLVVEDVVKLLLNFEHSTRYTMDEGETPRLPIVQWFTRRGPSPSVE
jgi:hypothetical protein